MIGLYNVPEVRSSDRPLLSLFKAAPSAARPSRSGAWGTRKTFHCGCRVRRHLVCRVLPKSLLIVVWQE